MPVTYGIAGDIDSKGIELSATVRPIEGLTVWGNVALTDAKFGSDVNSNGDFTGNTPPNVAPIIYNTGASYHFETQNWWHWVPMEIGASVRHVGNRFIFDDNEITMNEYTVADAYWFIEFNRPTMLPKVEKTRLTFRVRNLTNTQYAAYADSGYQDQVYLGAPRTYEAMLSFKW